MPKVHTYWAILVPNDDRSVEVDAVDNCEQRGCSWQSALHDSVVQVAVFQNNDEKYMRYFYY